MAKKIIYVTLTLALAVSAFFVGQKYPSRENHINMESVTDFEATESGLMLYTSTGDGYYWEKEVR